MAKRRAFYQSFLPSVLMNRQSCADLDYSVVCIYLSSIHEDKADKWTTSKGSFLAVEENREEFKAGRYKGANDGFDRIDNDAAGLSCPGIQLA
jgi:hypothetical protein